MIKLLCYIRMFLFQDFIAPQKFFTMSTAFLNYFNTLCNEMFLSFFTPWEI